MIGIVVGGIVSAAAILFLIFKFGKIRRVLAFDIPIDVTSTLGLTFLLGRKQTALDTTCKQYLILLSDYFHFYMK